MAVLQLSHGYMLSADRLNHWHIITWLALYTHNCNQNATSQWVMRQLRDDDNLAITASTIMVTRGCEYIGHKTTFRVTGALMLWGLSQLKVRGRFKFYFFF
jgi:hypothetical protein